MATGEQFGTIFDGGTTLGLGSAELLDRFGVHRDEAAFAALVAHHGPMVLATCRRILPNSADADDAFQATFLVLARRASSIADPDRLAPWLHGVARRVALRARSLAARRQAIEGERAEPGEDDPAEVAVAPPPADAFELRSVLDEELARLPAKYRVPLVLCYLEGLTHDEAAGQLAWPVGTVRSRLAGGRDRLRSRLARRGFDPRANPLPPNVPLAVVSRPLQTLTLRLALATGAPPAASLAAVLLARGVLTSMLLTKIQTALVALAATISLVAGAAGFVAARQPDPAPAGAPATAPALDEPRARPAPRTMPPTPRPSAAPRPIPEKTPLNISGRALDSAGRPIAGARIFLASCATDDNRRLAETRTDAAGAYKFQDVPLLIRPDVFADPKRRIEGVFQVFGLADGFGFAWAAAKRVRVVQWDPPVNTTFSWIFFVKLGTPVWPLDLTFPPPAPLTGRVTDDKGHPLADARIWISAVARPRRDRPFLVAEIDSFRGTDTVPPELNQRRTDADGRFTFANLPPDHWFELDVRPRGFPARRVAATMTPPPWPEWSGRKILTGPLDLVFATPREIAVRVVAADTGRPLERAFFSTGGEGGSDSGLTDADGRCTLRLAPGEATYSALPRFATPYLETRGTFTIPGDGPIAPLEFAVRAACVLEVTVTDADTGAPIADADLWEDGPSSADPSSRRKALAIRSFEAPNLVHSDRARTGADGKLRTFAEPGSRRVGVGFAPRPDPLVAVEPDGQAIDGQPGQTLTLSFTMRRPPANPRRSAP